MRRGTPQPPPTPPTPPTAPPAQPAPPTPPPRSLHQHQQQQQQQQEQQTWAGVLKRGTALAPPAASPSSASSSSPPLQLHERHHRHLLHHHHQQASEADADVGADAEGGVGPHPHPHPPWTTDIFGVGHDRSPARAREEEDEDEEEDEEEDDDDRPPPARAASPRPPPSFSPRVPQPPPEAGADAPAAVQEQQQEQQQQQQQQALYHHNGVGGDDANAAWSAAALAHHRSHPQLFGQLPLYQQHQHVRYVHPPTPPQLPPHLAVSPQLQPPASSSPHRPLPSALPRHRVHQTQHHHHQHQHQAHQQQQQQQQQLLYRQYDGEQQQQQHCQPVAFLPLPSSAATRLPAAVVRGADGVEKTSYRRWKWDAASLPAAAHAPLIRPVLPGRSRRSAGSGGYSATESPHTSLALDALETEAMLLAGMPSTNASRPAAVAAAAAFRAVAPFLEQIDRTELQHIFTSAAPKDCLVAVLEVVTRIASSTSTNGFDVPGMIGRQSRLTAGGAELSSSQGLSLGAHDRSPTRQNSLHHLDLRPLNLDGETSQLPTPTASSGMFGLAESDSTVTQRRSSSRFPGTSLFMPGGLFSDFPATTDLPATGSAASALQGFGFGGSTSLSPFVTAPASDLMRSQPQPFGHADDASVSSGGSSGLGGNLWSTRHPFVGPLTSWPSVLGALNARDTNNTGNAFDLGHGAAVGSDLSRRQPSLSHSGLGFAGESLWVTPPAPSSGANSSPISQPSTFPSGRAECFSPSSTAANRRYLWNAQGSRSIVDEGYFGDAGLSQNNDIVSGTDMIRDRDGPARSRAENPTHHRFSAP